MRVFARRQRPFVDRRADRWASALREGKARYDEAAGDWGRQWSALLPLGALARVCWERVRGRLTVGDAGRYVRVSAIRPAVVVLCLALLGAAASPWSHDLLLTAQARRLAERFGGNEEADAVLLVWHSPAHLRQRVHDLVRADEALLKPAVRSNWPFAHAGLEPPRVREAAAAVRARLERERDPGVAGALASAYAAVAARLNDSADLKAEAAAVRARLERERDPRIANRLALAYAAVAARLNDATEVKGAAATLRARLEQEQNPEIVSELAGAYAAVAARLTDAADVKAAAATLRARLERARDPWIAGGLAEAYAAVAGPAVERADAKDRSALVLDILVLAGHPFVMDASPLLSALKPATGEDFGANIGAAVRWAQQTYDIRPDRLRPPPP